MENWTFDDLPKEVSSRIHRSLALSNEKGASIDNWPTVLPIAEYMGLLYTKVIFEMPFHSDTAGHLSIFHPAVYVANLALSVEHALHELQLHGIAELCRNILSCISDIANCMRDLTVNLLDEICME